VYEFSFIDNFPVTVKTKQNTCGQKACQTRVAVILKCLVTGYQASALSPPGINALEETCLTAVLLVVMLQFAALHVPNSGGKPSNKVTQPKET
jgi:hypothetical protein